MVNIVLHEPEMPANTGNIGRTCVATGSVLHLIEPLGFKINDKMLKRAGLDYWDKLDVRTYVNFEDFLAKNPGAKIYMATTKSKQTYTDVEYDANEVIDQVRVERRKELCLEGHRWFDLRRYAVCKKAPFKKNIERVYAIYNWESRNIFKYAEVYQLKEDDLAYVFAIPKSVLEFDKGMPDNIRENREYVRLIYRNNE